MISETILRLERAALERWGKGDPDGFLEISAPDVTYFDPFLEHALVGLDALRGYYALIRGKVFVERFDILEPQVQVVGNVAVLAYRFDSWGGGGSAYRWNTTEVYREGDDGWRIIHTHWAFTGGAR
ncbi:MAG: nuclear transport factor 2 family protein [Polyangiaceae bacterium]|nr:nuclear transport factor 2 family protein [Polyangiaceae bacterium]